MFGQSAANLLADRRHDKILALLSLSELLIHGWLLSGIAKDFGQSAAHYYLIADMTKVLHF